MTVMMLVRDLERAEGGDGWRNGCHVLVTRRFGRLYRVVISFLSLSRWWCIACTEVRVSYVGNPASVLLLDMLSDVGDSRSCQSIGGLLIVFKLRPATFFSGEGCSCFFTVSVLGSTKRAKMTQRRPAEGLSS